MQNLTVAGSGNNLLSTEGRRVYLRGTSEILAVGGSIYYAWALDSRGQIWEWYMRILGLEKYDQTPNSPRLKEIRYTCEIRSV